MRARRDVAVVHALFFLSGAAGLVYQVVWSRLLNQVFGVTAHAVTAVLATFLGGLALGGWILGRVADRRPNPLRLYGLLEIGIGLSALAGTWLVRLVDPLHMRAASSLSPTSPALVAIRLALASAVILPPTFLMGGTLPAITRVLVERIGRLGRQLSLLYALNTSGAVAGSLAAGFLLIRALGVHPTLWLAVAINLGVGAISLALARGAAPSDTRALGTPPAAVGPDPGPTPARFGAFWLLVALALSGVASLGLEVIWTRMLVVVLGTSTYAFVTMLSAFLVGIACGSFAARAFVDRIADPRRTFGWIQVGIVASTLATIPLMSWQMGSMQRWIEGLELHWATLVAARFGVSFLIMIVPTTLIGTTFPLAAKIWAREVSTLGGRLGQVYGANTLGNIAGAVVGGFVVLPAVGMQRGIAFLCLANLAAAGWALLPSGENRLRPRAMLRAAPVSAGLWLCALMLVLWHPRPLDGTGGTASDPVRFYREGLVSTVKVVQRADDGRQLLMFVDGITIGQSTEGVDKKQQVLAHFPFVLAPDRPPSRILSIGLGTGILVGEVARHPGVERVECVELSPSVIEGARLFADYSGNVLENPAVHVIADDGINFLRRSPDRYDAIISDGKSKSGHAGNALFYSLEYYRSARDHLAPGGTMIQWVPFDVAPEDLRTIVRTFASAFSYVYVWLGYQSCFLVGQERPLVLDLERVQRALDAPAAAHLRRHGWTTASELAVLLVADRPALRDWLAREDTVNSQEKPALEFYPLTALAAPEARRVAANVAALPRAPAGSLRTVRLLGADPAALDAGTGAVGDVVAALSLPEAGSPTWWARIEGAVARSASEGVVRHMAAEDVFQLGYALDRRNELAAAAAAYRRALEAFPGLVEARVNLGRDLALEGRTDEAIAEMRRALEVNPRSASAHRWLAKLLRARGDLSPALAHAAEAVRITASDAESRDELAILLATAGRTDDAIAEFREAMRLRPDWPEPMDGAAVVLATRGTSSAGDREEAVRLARRAVGLTDSRDPRSLEVLASAYAASARFDDAVREQGRAVEVASAAGNRQVAEAAAAVLELYRRKGSLSLRSPGGAREAKER